MKWTLFEGYLDLISGLVESRFWNPSGFSEGELGRTYGTLRVTAKPRYGRGIHVGKG
jgi:hypothetical protein